MINVQLNIFNRARNKRMVCSTRNRNDLHSTSSFYTTIGIPSTLQNTLVFGVVDIVFCSLLFIWFFTLYFALHSLFGSSISVRDIFFSFHQINNIPAYCSETYRFFGHFSFFCLLNRKREKEENRFVSFLTN